MKSILIARSRPTIATPSAKKCKGMNTNLQQTVKVRPRLRICTVQQQRSLFPEVRAVLFWEAAFFPRFIIVPKINDTPRATDLSVHQTRFKLAF